MKKFEPVGIIGAGKFGMALAKLISHNTEVLLYSRRKSLVDQINKEGSYRGIVFDTNVKMTNSLEEVGYRCNIIMPVIPSVHFRNTLIEMNPFLNPKHILIHGTKGFDILPGEEDENGLVDIQTEDIKTMSDVILEETDVMRIGALCGPNLADEILEGLPTATVIASEFNEVIHKGREILGGKTFFVFGSHDLKGAELAGALKNVIALASGVLGGKKLGKNSEAMLITRGLREMIHLGGVMGSHRKAFLGTAGIGDLIATATSDKSRNYSCGKRIAQGEELSDILESMEEVVEGLRSLQIAYHLIRKFKIHAPIITAIYRIIYENKNIEKSVLDLMKYPFAADVDFD